MHLTDIEKVRDALERLSVEPYEWDTHPSIRSKILELPPQTTKLHLLLFYLKQIFYPSHL